MIVFSKKGGGGTPDHLVSFYFTNFLRNFSIGTSITEV